MVSDTQRQRYGRQILLPEIGLAGQATLLSKRVAIPEGASPAAEAVATAYLERSGLTVAAPTTASTTDEDAEAEGGSHPARQQTLAPVPNQATVEASAGSRPLIEASAALHGALAAVEAIKHALGVGTPAASGTSAPPIVLQRPDAPSEGDRSPTDERDAT